LRIIFVFIPLIIFAAFVSGCDILNLAASDQDALDSLRDSGSDLTKVHPFDFYIYHPEHSGAEQICAHLQSRGFQVTLREGAVEGEWLCLAEINLIPSIEKLSELQGMFDEMISQYGGEYDGWETIVIPK
jgi:hypothetical protein